MLRSESARIYNICMNYDFEIKNAQWIKVAATVFASLGALTAVSGMIFVMTGTEIGASSFVPIALIVCGDFFFIFGVAVLYPAITEKFVLSDGVFHYYKPFGKDQSAAADAVVEIRIRRINASTVDVVFCDRNGNKLIDFRDDGTVFKSGEFEKALTALSIPTYRLE